MNIKMVKEEFYKIATNELLINVLAPVVGVLIAWLIIGFLMGGGL